MIKYLYAGVLGLLVSCSCTSCSSHAHGADEHNHTVENHNHSAAEHNHAADEHDHANEGHDHDAENHTYATGDHNHAADEHGQSEADAHKHNPDEVVMSPAKAEAAGVVVAQIEPGDFRRVIVTGGRISSAQGHEATVVASVAGIVSFSHSVTEGMKVGAGTPLMSISAEHLQNGDPVKRARIAYETAKKEYDRAAKLVQRKIVSQKDFNVIKENYETAKIAYEALAVNKSGKGVAVKSPMAGYVKACLVKEGDYVNVGQPLMSVTQTNRLQLKADVSERYYPVLHSITSANFKTPYSDKAYTLDDLNGRLLSYGRAAGDASFYVPVTFEFDNRGDILPGAYVEVYLLSDVLPHVISVPVGALIEEQGVYSVYVQLDADCYHKQEVKLGSSNGNEVEIVSGLKGGEKIVTQGAYQVKLASASNAIPGHTHNH